VIIAAISLGFAFYMLGTGILEWLVSVALRTGVFRAAWNHPQSLIALLLFAAGALAVLWAVVPRVARAIRRATHRKRDDNGEPVAEESPAGR
jgi:membrane protein implicated in regulation of membrane protease activity